jgi:glycosyltransferase involved in cell wall biosynthesis
MKILFVHNRYQQPGGEDRALELESSLLIEKGHEVKILIFDNQGITGSWFQKIITFKNAIYNPASATILRYNILEFKPDIIHFHNIFFVASPAVLQEAARQGIPVVATLHNYRLICSNALLLRENKPCEICVQKKLPLSGIRYACYRKSAGATAMVTLSTGLPKLWNNWRRWADRYIVLTNFAKEKFLLSSLGALEEQLVVKPNFVPDPGMGTAPRENFFLFAGRLSIEKGVYILLEAFKNLPDKKLRVVGEGPEKDILKSIYSSADNIEFLGLRNNAEILDLMKKSLALVFPSIWYEGLPFVMLEAFSTGTPILSSNLGAMASLVIDGFNGLFFSPSDVGELQSAVMRFSEQSTFMYQNARQTYLDHFHPDIHYNSIMEIYEQSIRKNAGGNE